MAVVPTGSIVIVAVCVLLPVLLLVTVTVTMVLPDPPFDVSNCSQPEEAAGRVIVQLILDRTVKVSV